MNIVNTCVMCDKSNETIQHIFFSCPAVAGMWKQVLHHFNIINEPGEWAQEYRWFIRRSKSRSVIGKKLRALMAAAVYEIWMERQ